MTVQMTGRELDEIVRELYVLPPADFVAARNELVRAARAAGSREIAERLQHLRRPTRSAWLVNVLARDSAAMRRLSTLGKELRDAQTGLDSTQLRTLSEQRRRLITDLVEQAQAHASDAGLRLTATVLSEVEATLQAALVDLAGALTIRNGRLVRPLSHSGFGPRPRSTVPQIRSTADVRPVEIPAETRVEIEGPAIEDELAARRRRTDRTVVEHVEVTDPRSVVYDDSTPAPNSESGAHRELRRAEQELAAAEAVHWQAEFELADAEGAVEAAEDHLSSLDTQRIEARRDKVTAERYLAEAQSRQRDAVNTLAEARRRLDAARRLADSDE
ncbi:MAG TPA: hypothetical protein VJW23_12215 [Propionibacteriaceae bacterium]|nr:hypothetical protein [Propionibacteriaceae bacterium]